MKPTIKKLWVNALRSGKYKQGRGSLCKTTTEKGKTVTEYCCLGVLGDVAVDAYWEKNPTVPLIGGKQVTEYGLIDEVNTGFLPNSVEKQLGLTRSRTDKLVELNDDSEFSFDDIADYIEKHL